MKTLNQHILERLILSKTRNIPDGEFNINWATDSINKFKDYYKTMNEKHGFNLPDIAMTAKFRPIAVVYYDKFDPSDSDQNAVERVIYKIKENIKFSELYDIIIKYFEDNTDYLLDESLNERLVLSKNRNNFVNDDEEFIYNRKAGVFDNSHTFIHDYYFKRVKIDGYKKLENNDIIDVFFVGRTIYRQYKGKLTRFIMAEVEDGDTFGEVYDRMIDNLRGGNISLLEK
jgi:hypothetical protein